MASRFNNHVEEIRKSWEQQAALHFLNDEMKLIELIDQHPEIWQIAGDRHGINHDRR